MPEKYVITTVFFGCSLRSAISDAGQKVRNVGEVTVIFAHVRCDDRLRGWQLPDLFCLDLLQPLRRFMLQQSSFVAMFDMKVAFHELGIIQTVSTS